MEPSPLLGNEKSSQLHYFYPSIGGEWSSIFVPVPEGLLAFFPFKSGAFPQILFGLGGFMFWTNSVFPRFWVPDNRLRLLYLLDTT